MQVEAFRGLSTSVSETPTHGQLNSFLDYPLLALCTIYFNWLEETSSDYSAS